ncbi:MAG: potassium channel protein [Chloroflexota bacterium]
MSSSPEFNKENANRAQESLWQQGYQLILSWLVISPLLTASLILFLLLAVGTVGYMVIEGWSFFDSLFMIVITISTIGYGEVHELSDGGRIFTIGLIIVGVITATYTIGATVEKLTSIEFLNQIRTRRKRYILNQLHDHTIICGYGRMGRSLADELIARQAEIVVIDASPEVVETCQQSGIIAIQGSASDEAILFQAGIERAQSLVAATRTDAENVFIVLTARGLNPKLQIFARSNARATIPKLEIAGADQVISPYAITGQRIAQMLTKPNVIRFLDGFLDFGDKQMTLEEFVVDENSPIAGLTLREAQLGVAVLAVDYPGQMVFTHPKADTQLMPGAAIVVLGTEEALSEAEKKIT